MVREIGRVVSVVNDDMVLLELSEHLEVETEVVVFYRQAVDLPSAGPERKVREIVVPKGHLEIRMDEGDNLYLAERFRPTIDRIRPITHALFRTVESVPGPWSATIDASPMRSVSRKITAGDLVGLEEDA